MNNKSSINILLGDDDKDDCLLFQDALEELEMSTTFKAVNDGEQLMHYLTEGSNELPTVLFLDLNMPRKNGFECLEEIKSNENLKQIPVIIFSTSYDETIADRLYKNGAQHYICKPADFSDLKKVIQQALMIVAQKNSAQPPKKDFLLNRLKAILL